MQHQIASEGVFWLAVWVIPAAFLQVFAAVDEPCPEGNRGFLPPPES